MKCPICEHEKIADLEGRFKDGTKQTFARWCAHCGTLTKPDGSQPLTPTGFIADHVFVSAGMCIAAAIVKDGNGDLLRFVDEHPDDASVFNLIARRRREDTDENRPDLRGRYNELVALVTKRIRQLRSSVRIDSNAKGGQA